MTTDITNRDRAEHFASALARYHDDDWDLKSSLIDLLADVRHWCDMHRDSYAEFDRIAYGHYLAELAEERGGQP